MGFFETTKKNPLNTQINFKFYDLREHKKIFFLRIRSLKKKCTSGRSRNSRLNETPIFSFYACYF